MGTDSWTIFLKKIGKTSDKTELKKPLNDLPLSKLKFLAKKFNIKVKGRTEENWFSTTTICPSKKQFVNALFKKVSKEDIENVLKEFVEPIKKKKKRTKNSGLFFQSPIAAIMNIILLIVAFQ